MDIYIDKLPLQILYYIRQAGEISFSDLCRKVLLNKNAQRDSVRYRFLHCLSDLHSANFIKISNKNSNIDAGPTDGTDGDDMLCTYSLLSFALQSCSRSTDAHFDNEIKSDDIIISVTDYFYTVQQTIGFSVTAEIMQLQKEIQCCSILGEINPRLESKVFVIMPFKDDFNPIYEDHIVSVCKKLKYTCTRADLIDSPNVIINDIWSHINNADIIICDCTQKNPNVFYELGLAHALGKKVICITQNADDIPFDIKQIRYIKYEYNPRGMKEFEVTLKRYLVEENITI